MKTGKIQHLPDFSALSQHIRPQWIAQALAASGKISVRGRKFPAEQVVWPFIALAMYRHQSIAQVVAELDLARDDELSRGEALGLSEDDVRFYDALLNNESAVKELADETLKKIAHELTDNLRKNLTVDWSQRESVRASLRLMVKRILRIYKYPPDLQDAAVELVLQQAEALGQSWM